MPKSFEERKKKIIYLLIYTVIFLLLYFVCFGQWFFKYNKALFRLNDGLDQHYLIFVYIGKLGRQIIRGLLIDHKLSVPLWNMGIGYGADIITSLGAYLPDPFNWISIITPTRYSEIAYNFSIILKLYFCGLAFSFFAFEKKCSYFQGIIGSIIYVFSGTALMIFVEPFLINPLYLFPIIIVGIDRLWKNKSHFKLYIGFLALIFINYFYFGYMAAILIMGYCIIKFFCLPKEQKNIRNLLQLVMRFLICSLLAVGISMIVVLPIVLVVMDAGRIGADFYTPIIFSQEYYSGIISGFTTTFNMLGRDCFIGYGVISLPCVVMLFLCKNKYKSEKIEFILLTIGLCVPFFGKIMNGFGYTANRWVWAYTLLVAYIVALTIPMFKNIDFNQKLIIGLVTITYIVVVCAVYDNHSSVVVASAIALIFIAMILLGIKNYKIRTYKILCLAIAGGSVALTNYYVFNEKYGDFTQEWVDSGRGLDYLYDNEINKLLNEVNVNSADRYDKSQIAVTRNVSWLYGISGMDFYISIYNNNIDKFHNDVSLITSSAPMDYHGLNGRSDLNYLMGVKHIFIPEGKEQVLPYGYSVLEGEIGTENEKKYQSYTTDKENSIVHGINNLISEEEYKDYNPYEKQQVLMQAGVVKEISNEEMTDSLKIANDEVIYEITDLNNVQMKKGIYEVGPGGGTITLSFDSLNNKEIYVWLDDLDYKNGEKFSYQINMQAKCNEKDIEYAYKSAGFTNNKCHMYGGRHSWMFNLGRIQESVNNIVITLPEEGCYTIKQIKLFGESNEHIEENRENLPSIADNEKISNNSISFDLKSTKDKYMLLSIPYSKGWKAYVNGEKRSIKKCDDAFMLIKLNEQDKYVELKYFTPGLFEGSILTLLSLVMFAFLIRKDKKDTFFRRNKRHTVDEIQ